MAPRKRLFDFGAIASQISLWIVNETHQMAHVWSSSISPNVQDKFVAYLVIWAGQFQLSGSGNVFNQKINPRRATGVIWSPFFIFDRVVNTLQNHAEHVL